jgi:Flp pilus assembly protein TadB
MECGGPPPLWVSLEIDWFQKMKDLEHFSGVRLAVSGFLSLILLVLVAGAIRGSGILALAAVALALVIFVISIPVMLYGSTRERLLGALLLLFPLVLMGMVLFRIRW